MLAKKVLVFWGPDLVEVGPEPLNKAHQDGFTLLALDAGAVAAAAAAGLPYTFLQDWLDEARLCAALDQAMVCNNNWFAAAKKEFTVDSFCWPELEDHFMDLFWKEVMLAEALAQAMMERGVEQWMFFSDAPPGRGKCHSGSEIAPVFWQKYFADKVIPITRSAPIPPDDSARRPLEKVKAILRPVRDRLAWTCRSWCGRTMTTDADADKLWAGRKIIMVFSSKEFFRFQPIIRELADCFPGKVIISFTDGTGKVGEIAAKSPAPVVLGPHLAGDPRLRQRFMAGYQAALKASAGQVWQRGLECFESHFAFYCQNEWPMLTANLDYWERQLQRYRPKVLIVTSWRLQGVLLATEAACRRGGITSFTIPHGAADCINDCRLVDKILYSTETQRISHKRMGSATEMIGCRGLVLDYEHPMTPVKAFPQAPGWKVLALTDPLSLVGSSFKYVNIKRQFEALKALDNPPADIADKLVLRVKLHPTSPGLELIPAAGEGLPAKVLPLDADLYETLAETDLVVAVNYFAAALMHTLKAGVPAICFLNDSEAYLHRTQMRRIDLFWDGMMVARTPQELWELVRKFCTDPEFAQQMRRKAAEFSRRMLDGDHFPGICEIISKYL